ncbi:signal peptide peptidase-like protein 2 [Tanacetum coccineum]
MSPGNYLLSKPDLSHSSDSDTVASPRPRAENEPRGQNELSRKQKVKGKLTDSIFNEMLEFFQNVFPTAKGYKLPPSYYAIKKTFKMIGLGYESIHACVNDCFLFRGDANKDVHFCPVCNTSRWKDSNTPGKKVPKKVLRYFPIIPRLQCLYKSSHTAKEMTWHATGKCTEPGKMQHPVDGRAWKDFDTKYLDFAAEPRNVRLGLAADGFNPFGNLSQSYSMWSVILTTYNLPSWLCMKESSFMLTLLITGPKSPGKDIDVYLRPLIDDLKVLWVKPGVETIDVATGLKLNMRAMVLWTINDFPARSKTAYVGHRRFLKKPHKWRRSLEFNGETENGDPPREFSRDAIMTQLARLPPRVKGKHPRKVIDILRSLELIYPPAFFDIMIHLVIYLPLEAIFGGPIRPRWMYPFERYMKKLKNYVRNKAKPEGSIAEGYVAKEALTFSSHYFRDVTMKFNCPDRNVDCPPPTCQFQVFKSLCKSIGLRSVIRIDHQELKKVIWYVLHNSPEIDTYRAKFKIEFPNKDMKEEFPGWFGKQIRQRHVDNDPGVNESSELFALACGPSQTPISVNFWLSTVCEDDPDVIHVDNSSDLALSTSLNDLEIAALHIDGQSIDVDAPPDIIDVVDEDDDIIDEEDPIPHDLADSDDEDLVNLDIDDGVNVMSADVARGHGGDGGGDDRPPPYQVPTGYRGCLGNRGRAHTISQFGWQESG